MAPQTVAAFRAERGAVLPDTEARRILAWEEGVPRGPALRLWRPAPDELRPVEYELADTLGRLLARAVYLPGEPVPAVAEYYRQYAAYIGSDGHRHVAIHGVHQWIIDQTEALRAKRAARVGTASDSAGDWRQSYIGVGDGGVSCFAADYDLEVRRFLRMELCGRYDGPVTYRGQ